MADSRIDILIAARDQASAQIKAINTELKSLGAGGNEAADGVGALLGSLGALAGIAAASQFTKFALDADAAATAYRRQSVAALTLAGSQSNLNSLISAYDQATGGAVDKATALHDITRLQAIGFADDAAELGKFATAARGISVAMGSQQDYVISQLQLAIANQSTMRLDQLGLGVSEVQARIAQLKAADSGLTTEMAFQNAVLGLATEKYGGLATSLEAQATGAEKAAKAWKNFGLEFGTALGPVTGGVMQGLANEIKGISELIKGAADDAKAAKKAFDEMGGDKQGDIGLGGLVGKNLGAAINYDFVKGAREAITGVTDATIAAAAAEQHLEDNHAQLAARTTELSAEEIHLKIQTDLAGGAAAAYAAQVRAAGGATDAMNASVVSLAGALPALQARLNTFLAGAAQARNSAVSALASKAVGTNTDDATRQKLYAQGIAQIDSQTQALNQSLRDGVITQDAYTLAIAGLGTGAGDAFDEITEGQREAEAAAKRFASTMESDVKKAARDAAAEFDKLQGKVQGVLQSALGGAGVDPSTILRDPKDEKSGTLLPREDDINEQARRLADIAVNGFKGQDWLGKFKDAVPNIWKVLEESGDPRATAAQLLKNFQDGLEPELLDKEKAKERVRKMLIGEQNMAELAKEITQELQAEFGNAAPVDLASQVNSALGVGGGAGTKLTGGDAAGSAFGAGAADAAASAGNKMISALDATLRADNNVNLIKSAGENAGSNWGNAFMTTVGNNVPKALIDLITSLVTPQVVSYFNTQSTLTGATP